MKKTGIVFSGGSSKGAFSVGALEILQDRGVEFDIISGTSTGALIAPLVVTGEIDVLRDIYTNVDTGDIVRFWPIGGKLFSTGPLKKLIDRTIDKDRYERIMQSEKLMLITTVNLVSGQVMYWSNHEPDTDMQAAGVRFIRDRKIMCAALLASSSQPVLMPCIEVPKGGDPQVDGGIREVTPLKILIDAGATKIYAVVVNPEIRPRKEGNYRNLVNIGVRTIDLFVQEILANDIDRAITYNKTVSYLREVRQRALDVGLTPGEIEHIFDPPKVENPFNDKVAVELTIIRPEEALPAKNMKFDHNDMRRMVGIGRDMATKALGDQQVVPEHVLVGNG